MCNPRENLNAQHEEDAASYALGQSEMQRSVDIREAGRDGRAQRALLSQELGESTLSLPLETCSRERQLIAELMSQSEKATRYTRREHQQEDREAYHTMQADEEKINRFNLTIPGALHQNVLDKSAILSRLLAPQGPEGNSLDESSSKRLSPKHRDAFVAGFVAGRQTCKSVKVESTSSGQRPSKAKQDEKQDVKRASTAGIHAIVLIVTI